jgi:hypothetical protein
MVNFHKVLISTAIVFTLGFAVWSAKVYVDSREVWALASAVGFGVATIAFILYLRNLKRFLGEE